MVAASLLVFGFIKIQSHKIDNLQTSLKQVSEVAEQQGKQIQELKTDFKNIAAVDFSRKDSREQRDQSDTKMRSDANRANVVAAKPGLVEKQINNSFNKFIQDLQESTE